jgi:hypothetical protein
MDDGDKGTSMVPSPKAAIKAATKAVVAAGKGVVTVAEEAINLRIPHPGLQLTGDQQGLWTNATKRFKR